MSLIDLHWQNFLEDDNDAFSFIYKQYVNELYVYGLSLGFSSDICMDAIQDVFYKLYITKDKLKNILHPKTYLFRAFKNRVFDIQKHNRKTDVQEITDNVFSIQVTVLDSIVDEEERILLKNRIENLMLSLSDRQREAIYLRYMQDLDYEDIAQVLGLQVDSVRKLVYRGLESIRKNISGNSISLTLLLNTYFFS
ncbi:MAG TPA: sigma-70 family RNA polymerase sigma factor [Petrimonas sp.]|uniref:RNA polymerase sigma factor n=1 Tax=Petrimonas sp. TaxID=2023866 RepID=UPI00177A631C|nr:sigma-70 family RNA polymerase sigma factor [Petrimonas sp.]